MTQGAPKGREDDFLARWRRSGAAERANYQLFLVELCDYLGVERPAPTQADDNLNDYVFERAVTFEHPDGTTSHGRIDLYKRGAFVLEAKQGGDRVSPVAPAGATAGRRSSSARRGTAQRGTAGWDDAMISAHGQGARYAQAIARVHGWTPFLIVVDVGHEFHVYADFSREHHGYRPFPDPAHNRFSHEALEQPDTKALLRTIWTDPWSLDPAHRRMRVTQEIAGHLAGIARSFEASGHEPKAVSEFLMRAVFTMFAEDIGLLPKDSFLDLLTSLRGKLAEFPAMVEHLWQSMDKGGFSPIVRKKLLEFNGGLFENSRALPVTAEELEALIAAARAEWQDVEPAIFGTMLERALDSITRHTFGAHFTPREFVERLVVPVVIEPLRDEWDTVLTTAVALAKRGDEVAAAVEVKGYLARLCKVKILDPAAGSSNFLYVTLEHLKMLEGEVRQSLQDFGETAPPKMTVTPDQLIGLEVNERAAVVGDLVLWIGYLQWHYRVHPGVNPPEPVMNKFRHIECKDAVLAYDRKRSMKDPRGRPVTRWDGRTFKEHPTTGEQVPDETARVEVFEYDNPKPTPWPKADFVVGNPPFIGAGPMRASLGDGYTEALREAHDVPKSIDFVVYWWNHAAKLLRAGEIRRFGFITTNSIRQTFNRRVIEQHLAAEDCLSIVFAIQDHPWVDAAGGADVRISMTVAQKGSHKGILAEAVESDGRVSLVAQSGQINADLTIGVDVTRAVPLLANGGLCSNGVKLHGAGFIVSPAEAKVLGLGKKKGLERHIRPYLNGRDIAQKSRGSMVIDLFGLSVDAVRQKYPEVYQHVVERVKPERDVNRRATYRDNWWIHGEPRSSFRPALKGLPRFIATTRTSKHRIFTFLDESVLPDDKLVNIASDDAYILGILSSRIHVVWATHSGAHLGVGNDPCYHKTQCYDPFPFPVPSSSQEAVIRKAADELDQHRWGRLREHSATLTITGLYNVLANLRAGKELTAAEQLIHDQGLVSVLHDLHDQLDAAVAAAYGWPADLGEQAILANLISLNARRSREEANGTIRYLRPDYQTGGQGALTLDVDDDAEDTSTRAAVEPSAIKPIPWPNSLPEQVDAMRRMMEAISEPISLKALSAFFTGVEIDVLHEIVEVLARLGKVDSRHDGKFVVFTNASNSGSSTESRASSSDSTLAEADSKKGSPAQSRFEKVVETRLALATYIVGSLEDDKHLGRTKFSKIFYMADQVSELDLQMRYVREAAGPLDQRALYNPKIGIEAIAAQRNLFVAEEKRRSGKLSGESVHVKYIARSDLPKAVMRAKETLESIRSILQIERVVELMRPMTTEQSEIVATLYACWHDLLSKGRKVSDKVVIDDFLQHWHEKKQRFGRPQLQAALAWMKQRDLVPTGRRAISKPKTSKIDF